MIRDYSILAYRNVKKRGIRSVLTLLGIIIGISTVIALISLGGALQNAVLSQFGISSTEVITIQAGGINSVGPPGTGVSKPLTESDVQAIDKISSVDAAIARHIETVKLEFNDKLVVGTAGDLPRGERKKIIYEILSLKVELGKLLEDDDFNRVLLGNNFKFKDKNGFSKAVAVGNRIKINGKDYQVKGILEKRGSFIIDNIVLLNEDSLSEISDYGENVDLISVKVKNSELLDETQKTIENLLRKRRDVKKGSEDFEVSTQRASLERVNQIIGGVKIFVVLVAAVSILVGAIGIVNTMTTSVLERVKEIGVMKAIGAKNSDVFYQFFIESGLLGLFGGIIGVILGVGMGYAGTTLIGSVLGAKIYPDFSIALFIITLIASFFLGTISGVVPSLVAARQKPVEALRS